jgi:RHS repeat-associated protein
MPMNDCSAGNPIKIGSGVKYQKETDFSVGRGRLKFERFYSSNAFDFDSPLGQQWSSNFHPRVRSNFRFTGGGQFELVLDTGETLKMSRYRDEDWTFAGIKDRPWKKAFAYGRNENDKTRVDYKLELTDTAELTLTHPDGMQQVFGHETWRYGAENPFLKKITYADGYEITLNRDAAGVLLSATDTDGYTISFGHDDRNLLTSVTAPDGSVYAYEYFALPGAIDATTITSGTVQSTWRFYTLMSAVIYPDNTASNSSDNPKKQYKYEHPKFLEALTSVIDERGVTVSTWDYAYFTDYGWRATSSSGPNGHELTQIEVVTPKQQYRVTNALGKETLFNYAQAGAIPRLTSIDGVASANCASSTQSVGRDTDGFPTTITGAEGQQETRIYDTATGFPSSITHGAGTNDAVTVSFAWDTALRKPTQITYPGLTTAITYGTNELPSQVTHTDTTSHTLPYATNGQLRTWSYGWTGEGLLQSIDGPLAGSGDTVSFTYDTNGNLASVTDEIGHVTTINSVDGMGRPTQITDPNGVVTSMTYTPRGWVEQITQSSGGNTRVTDLQYDLAGNLTRIDFPNGGWLTYTYNDSSWLTKVTSSVGDEIAYQHNLLGNITRADFQTAGAASIAWFTMQYDELGRLTQRLGGAGDALTYAYDRSDRRTTVTDGTGRPWLTGFDALNRVVSETDPELHSIGMDWSATDDLTSFTDGRNFSTTFVRNGFGDVVREVSPDRGTTDYWYDNAGRVTRILDAEGDDTQFSYDNAGRVLTETYPNQAALNVAYTYDSVSGGNSGTGRLTGVSGAESGHTFAYNGYGELTSKVSTVGSQSYTTTRAFNSSGQLSILTLPSGRAVDFGYDTNNRVTSITTTPSGGGATQTVVSNVTYAPFGSMTGYSFGNGASATFGLDSSLRLSSLNVSGASSTLLNKTYQYDANNRVTSIADSLNGANSATYTYKPDGRLASAVGPWGDFGWTYDAVGNRMTDTRYQASALIKDDVYNYSSSSNRLLSVDNNSGGVNRMISYTADGNINTDVQTTAPSRDYDYDDDGRLGSISANGSVVATYDYDAFEHRVRRIEGGIERHFVFSAGGMLLGEYDGSTGGVVTEYIWLNDRLVGSIDGAGVLSYVQTGHLGQPLLVMDGAGAATWAGETTPFGIFVGTTGTASDPDLRFPGQWNEAGSGLLHNWHRDYDPTLGRYIEADPLGIAAGQSLYGYVSQDPVNLIDPLGLDDEPAYLDQNLSAEEREESARRETMDALFGGRFGGLGAGADWTGAGVVSEVSKSRGNGTPFDYDVGDFIRDVCADPLDIPSVGIAGFEYKARKGAPPRAPRAPDVPPGNVDQRYNHPNSRGGPNLRGRQSD